MDILYVDNNILAVNKPSGLLTHQTKMSSDRDSLVDRLRNIYENPPSPVHRLDRATSGIVLCAFNSETARDIGNSFLKGFVHKSYLAIVRGFTGDRESIDIPLTKDGIGVMQEAITHYETIKKIEIDVPNNKYATSRYSLIRIFPETGRFHQIRRHMAQVGHPVLGDTSHGDLRHNRIFSDFFSGDRLLLHSDSLRFPHPEAGRDITITAPMNGIMEEIFNKFLTDF